MERGGKNKKGGTPAPRGWVVSTGGREHGPSVQVSKMTPVLTVHIDGP